MHFDCPGFLSREVSHFHYGSIVNDWLAEKGMQMDTNVAAVQQLMSTFLKREEGKVEERIQRFTEQQHAALLELETRVRQDRNAMLM